MSDEQFPSEHNTNPSAHELAEPVPNIDWPSETFSEPHDFGEEFNSPDEIMTTSVAEFSDTPAAKDTPPIAGVSEENGKKKRKRRKKRGKREKKERHETLSQRKGWYIEVVLSLCFFVLALLGLGILNVLIFTAPQTPGIGNYSTLYYAISVNVFGLIFVVVPFMFWRVNVWKCYLSKDEDEDKKLHLFDVLLGIALMALVIGVLCLLTIIYRYDFMIKPL